MQSAIFVSDWKQESRAVADKLRAMPQSFWCANMTLCRNIYGQHFCRWKWAIKHARFVQNKTA